MICSSEIFITEESVLEVSRSVWVEFFLLFFFFILCFVLNTYKLSDSTTYWQVFLQLSDILCHEPCPSISFESVGTTFIWWSLGQSQLGGLFHISPLLSKLTSPRIFICFLYRSYSTPLIHTFDHLYNSLPVLLYFFQMKSRIDFTDFHLPAPRNVQECTNVSILMLPPILILWIKLCAFIAEEQQEWGYCMGEGKPEAKGDSKVDRYSHLTCKRCSPTPTETEECVQKWWPGPADRKRWQSFCILCGAWRVTM